MKKSTLGWLAFGIILLIVLCTIFFKLRSSSPIKEITPIENPESIVEPSMKERWDDPDGKG